MTVFNKVPISFLLPVKNEGKNIDRALSSIAWADEVFVVDSGSTDDTIAIAQRHGAHIVQFKFNGIWPKKKNWALENLSFKHKWVFILDADEVLPLQAEEEIRSIVTQDNPPYVGYWINRRFLFMGRWLKHAYFPNWVLRLFLIGKGTHTQITQQATDSGDNEVHEPLVVSGATGRLKVMMDHYAFPDIYSFVDRHNRYSNWEARVELSQSHPLGITGTGNRLSSIKWKLRRIFTYLPCRPMLRFLYVYIFQCGFLDGKEGYYFARLHGYYEFLNVAKTYELAKKIREDHDVS